MNLKKILFAAILMWAGFVSHGRADVFENSYSTIVASYQNGVKIATGNISVDIIDVMAAGSSNSLFHVYDTNQSSSVAVKKYEGWSAASARFIPVAIDLTSGCYISNIGDTPATVRLKITPRSRY